MPMWYRTGGAATNRSEGVSNVSYLGVKFLFKKSIIIFRVIITGAQQHWSNLV